MREESSKKMNSFARWHRKEKQGERLGAGVVESSVFAIFVFPLRLSVTCRPLRLSLAFFAPEILKPLNLFWS
jgi:hypothetical protein